MDASVSFKGILCFSSYDDESDDNSNSSFSSFASFFDLDDEDAFPLETLRLLEAFTLSLSLLQTNTHTIETTGKVDYSSKNTSSSLD